MLVQNPAKFRTEFKLPVIYFTFYPHRSTRPLQSTEQGLLVHSKLKTHADGTFSVLIMGESDQQTLFSGISLMLVSVIFIYSNALIVFL